MALVRCKECKGEYSDTVDKCIHCGCPLSFGRIILEAADRDLGLFGKYCIKDENGKVLTKLSGGEIFKKELDEDETFYVSRSFQSVEVVAHANESNRFLIDMGKSGLKVTVTRIDEE